MSDGKNRIRAVVLGLIRNGDAVLVQHGVDPANGRAFFRLPGGGIEPGERAVEALRREFREELGAELVAPRRLEVIENVFVYGGDTLHEIVFLFEARFEDQSLYTRTQFVIEETSTRGHGSWKTAADFTAATPLYPPELLAFVGGGRR
jgi:ADP-ribose pyrophosphatase YjhB (NUDIX family)